MGCNNSKLNSSEGEVIPANIRPLLRQRIEEFRKRRNVREEGDLSKKELLKDEDINDGDSQTHSSDEHKIERTETQPPKDQIVVRVVVPVEKLSKIVPLPLPVSECESEEKLKNEKDVENKPEIKITATPQEDNKYEEVILKHDDDEDGDDDEEDETDEDDEDEENEIGRFIGPGSPSFRIYCIEAAEKRKEKEKCGARHIGTNECEKEKEKDKENEEGETDKEKEKETIHLHNKSPSTDSDESVASASEVVKMGTTPLKRRKRHNIKKLKKNLLNVKNIPMNRMMACAGNNNRRSLLSDK